jgi:rare lipoprotein A
MHRCALTVTLALGSALTATLPARAQAGQVVLHTFSGMAAYYSGRGPGFTAAHKTLPFGTRVRVTDLKTGRSVVVIITDRGPFNRGRVLDLCARAARALGMIDRGVIYVRAEILPRADVVAGP